jgi:16S rRNA (guanine527-N7)-methyltransferase
VKHPSENQTRLHLLLAAIDILLEESSESAMLRYLEAVIRANETLNLTRIDSAEAGIRLHLVDSLLALHDLSACPEGPLIDIGTGGGFPGVPLCVASGRAGVLLDSVGKKAVAVMRAIESAGLEGNIVATAERAESHAGATAAAYAVVTARAVAQLPALVELASPLLMLGGRLVSLKGSPADEELDRGDRVAEMVGMRRVALRTSVLPGGDERRTIVVYERAGVSRTKLPRRVGLAQNSPLA